MKKFLVILLFMLLNVLYGQDAKSEIAEKFNLTRICIDEGDAMMSHIFDGTIDKEGNIYLIDPIGIYKFDKKGKHIKSLSAKGKGPGEFQGLFLISINYKNELILLDNTNQKIVKYSTDLEFISEFKKNSIESVVSSSFLNDSLYITYSNVALFTAPITIYNTNSEKFVKSIGISSEVLKKYHIFERSGGLVNYEGNIYYASSLEYKLIKTELNGKSENILKEVPSHFREPDKKINTKERMNYPFSSIDRIFNLKGKFYVTSFTPTNEGKRKVLCDIISSDGKILEEELDDKIMAQCKQLDDTHLIRISDARGFYPEDDKRSAIIVRIMELKDGK